MAAVAAKVARERAHATDADLRAVNAAGSEDAQHVALDTRTDYINSVAQTEIDFPVVAARKAA
jgi:hypothetical protein